ncbi:MAG: hypothetical protein JW750_03645 [Anaerolineaceae bacterium]|nr:hypothetical protein [Anaerolineaceae bacterium]
MPQTQLPCPNCGQLVTADVNQLFDVGVDPAAKDLMLSGRANVAACQSCGYQGPVNLPIVYHDPEKELLLTYFPPELHIPVNQQEQVVGPYIRKVVDNLPPEKRKGYLFKPQTMLTMQRMIETILEADGITPEMLKNQQAKLQLLQRMITMKDDSRKTVVEQEGHLIDDEFFRTLNSLIQMTLAQNDQNSAKTLVDLQQFLFENTEKGKELKHQVEEAQAAINSLQEASKEGGLTQEKLLDLIIEAPTEMRLVTLINYAYQGLDYTFFSLFSQRIEVAEGETRQTLTERRDQVLEMRQQIERELAEQAEAMRALVNEIADAEDIEEAIGKHAQMIDQTFVEVLQQEVEKARKNLDLNRGTKLQKVMDIILEASKPPAEVMLVQELLETEGEEALDAHLEEHADQITSEFTQVLASLIQQTKERADVDQQTKDRLDLIYRKATRFIMRRNMANN